MNASDDRAATATSSAGTMAPSILNTTQGNQLSTSADSAASSASTSSSQSEATKERKHFKKVLQAFDAYLPYSLAANHARRRSFYALPRSHRLLLSSLGPPLPGPVLAQIPLNSTGQSDEIAPQISAPAGRGFKTRLDEIDDRIRRNADVLTAIVNDTRSFMDEAGDKRSSNDIAGTGNAAATASEQTQAAGVALDIPPSSTTRDDGKKRHTHASHAHQRAEHDVDKVRSTIKQLVRDWSIEGAEERSAAYGPILEALQLAFVGLAPTERSSVRVLVPGAGLGRLAFDIASLGFSCQGNEYSFYMLLASHFILNKTYQPREHVVYPFIHSSSNWRTAADMLRPVSVPDVKPSDMPSHVDFSMVAGEFIEVYLKEQERGAWHAVTTCYFIDTAHNFLRYLEVINHILPVGGAWINVGPLLWHYEGTSHNAATGPDAGLSIELTLDEVIGLIELMGFQIESRRTLSPQAYTGHPSSMLQYEYTPEFWLARKVAHIAAAATV